MDIAHCYVCWIASYTCDLQRDIGPLSPLSSPLFEPSQHKLPHTHTWVSSFKAFSGDWPVSWMQFTTWHDREAHSETISVKVYGHANQRHDAPLWPLQGLHIQC